MKELIKSKLKEIELQFDVHILLAVESGSRAWGFESPDSDYDVRFIYSRKHNEYLKLEETRDVIELPIDDMLDINGWDLAKALKLLYKSNPTLFEWLSSPIVYYRDDEFFSELEPLLPKYFSSKKGLYHYLSMAKGNYREYLQGEVVKAKKYFYVLRPVLASRWILDKGTTPPMKFNELVAAELPAELQSEVDYLLDIKMNSPEIKTIPRVDAVNKYLDESIEEISSLISELKEPQKNSWEPLDKLFLSTIQKG